MSFNAVQREKGEEPTNFVSRVDKIIGTLASLGVPKSPRNPAGDENRNLVTAKFRTRRLPSASKLLSYFRSFYYRRPNPCERKR